MSIQLVGEKIGQHFATRTGEGTLHALYKTGDKTILDSFDSTTKKELEKAYDDSGRLSRFVTRMKIHFSRWMDRLKGGADDIMGKIRGKEVKRSEYNEMTRESFLKRMGIKQKETATTGAKTGRTAEAGTAGARKVSFYTPQQKELVELIGKRAESLKKTDSGLGKKMAHALATGNPSQLSAEGQKIYAFFQATAARPGGQSIRAIDSSLTGEAHKKALDAATNDAHKLMKQGMSHYSVAAENPKSSHAFVETVRGIHPAPSTAAPTAGEASAASTSTATDSTGKAASKASSQGLSTTQVTKRRELRQTFEGLSDSDRQLMARALRETNVHLLPSNELKSLFHFIKAQGPGQFALTNEAVTHQTIDAAGELLRSKVKPGSPQAARLTQALGSV